jgi:polysaccharide export outer membrane protein
MRSSATCLICVALLLLAAVSARADGNDGFAPPQAAPVQRIATNTLSPPQAPSSPRAWTPPSDTQQSRYSTQNTYDQGFAPAPIQSTPQQAAPPTDVPQPRYSSQESPSQSVFAPAPTAQPRYASQEPQSAPVFVPANDTSATPAPTAIQTTQAPAQAAPAARYSSQGPAQRSPLPGPAPQPPQQRFATQSVPADLAPQQRSGYLLGSGDKVRVIVYGEDDLGGEFEVDGTGIVRLPLIGAVQAAGMPVRDFEQQIAARLSQGYLLNPRISVQVTSYRPFYIIGEVGKPGEYPYVNGMNVVNAVALAGGYTYRASESGVYVRRNGSQREEELPANERTRIYPGDIIRIAERFF